MLEWSCVKIERQKELNHFLASLAVMHVLVQRFYLGASLCANHICMGICAGIGIVRGCATEQRQKCAYAAVNVVLKLFGVTLIGHCCYCPETYRDQTMHGASTKTWLTDY